MNGKTHLIGGLAACAAVESLSKGFEPSPLFYVGGMIGAFLPDICHVHSTIGRKLPLISRMVSWLFGHRTFTHSLLFLLIVFFGMNYILPDSNNLSHGLLIGMSSHIILDMATVRGVRLFFPFNIRVRFPIAIRTGGKLESIFQVALLIWLMIWSYQFIQSWL